MKYKAMMTGVMLLVCAVFGAMVLSAHDMWFEMNRYYLQSGEKAVFVFPSDHVFPSPGKEFVPDKYLTKTYALDPKGKRIAVKRNGRDRYGSVSALKSKGTYLFVSGKKGLFWTRTTEGMRENVRKDAVEGALKGIYSAKYAKALVAVGGAGGGVYSRRIGHDLEIVPLADPCAMKPGDELKVCVYWKGKPFAAEIQATYDGFSREKNRFAQTVKTDVEGVALIKLTHSGAWLIKADKRGPYSVRKHADEEMHAATLTFGVK